MVILLYNISIYDILNIKQLKHKLKTLDLFTSKSRMDFSLNNWKTQYETLQLLFYILVNSFDAKSIIVKIDVDTIIAREKTTPITTRGIKYNNEC